MFKIPTKEEAQEQALSLMRAFANALDIKEVQVIDTAHGYWGAIIATFQYKGHGVIVQAFCRYIGDEGFQWDRTVPDWKENWQNNILITYRDGAYEHPECDYCEHSLSIERQIYKHEDAVRFAEEIKQMIV